ncbi:RICIN domain-containing protein [Kribbella sp. NBC_01505]|uniref:RICIN domain-containing protein n=1 Tax=Kribbella sp. NBC_01505 TaxID=2903580 RepID=UPI00386940C4
MRKKLVLIGAMALTLVLSVVVPSGTAFAASGKVQSAATGRCLAADYANVYTYAGCNVANQIWAFDLVGSPPPLKVRIRNLATGQCLANLDYFRVYMVACNSGQAGLTWLQLADPDHSASYYKNINTNKYLSTDYSNKVYLADAVSNQSWRIF